uniref:Putative salivary lipocalin n=1 Tax=Ixodes ricinus TaxID=34613 RepID=A0A0K8RFY3_IXORI
MQEANSFRGARDFISAVLSNMKAATFLFLICVSLTTQVMAHDGTQIDDPQYYESHQDINRALQNCDPFSWMYYRTYQPKLTDPEYACVYANVTKLNGTGRYMFMQGWTKADNQTIEVPLFVSTTKTPEYKGREDNAMHVTLRDRNGTIIRNFGLYELIYSDYEKCDILRVTLRGQACELYVHSKYLKEEELQECLRYYKQACVKQGGDDYKVYNKNCKTHQKAKPAATTLSQ